MTVTVEIPDSLYDQVKAGAALQGKTVEAFLVEAIREKLAEPDAMLAGPRISASLSDVIHEELAEAEHPGLRSVFGKGDKEAVAEVQRIIDEEFSPCYPQP